MAALSILTVGDEICIGQIINTNAAWIASECTRIGCNVVLHSTIGDGIDKITDELTRLLSLSDIVIVTGGLGPTHDDCTKEALCNYYNDTLVLHDASLISLKEILSRRGIEISDRNREQALLPSKCTALPNIRGTAPGMMFAENGKIVISLPGVPAEMKGIMTESVLPYIASNYGNQDKVQYKTLLTTVISEANLADAIGDPNMFLAGGTLAFLPSYQGVKLRIGVQGTTREDINGKIIRIENILREHAGRFIVSTDNESMSSVAAQLLNASNKTVAVAESCTGGLLGAAFSETSGSSSYFLGGAITYSNEAKEKQLNVQRKTLEEFGAVSSETVVEMASSVRELFGASYGIAISGIAGPDGATPEKPVGTIWMALAYSEGIISRKFQFGADRQINRERAVGAALSMLVQHLLKGSQL